MYGRKDKSSNKRSSAPKKLREEEGSKEEVDVCMGYRELIVKVGTNGRGLRRVGNM